MNFTNSNSRILVNDKLVKIQDLINQINSNLQITTSAKSILLCGDENSIYLSILFYLIQNNFNIVLSNKNGDEVSSFPHFVDAIIEISNQSFKINYTTPNVELELNTQTIGFYTTGSTGKPKLVCHDFEKLIYEVQQSKNSLKTILFFPVSHIGGFNTLIKCLKSNSDIYLPTKRDPMIISEMIEKYRIELLPTSPSFLNLLVNYLGNKKFLLSSLKYISFGSETMSNQLLTFLKTEFPHIKFIQTYGSTELGILNIKNTKTDGFFSILYQ